MTCIDKFSKFAVVQPINSRAIVDIKAPILHLVNFFPGTRTRFCDNEKALNSETIRTILANNFGIQISNVPPLHSTSNGQVEGFHITLAEIARCLKYEKIIDYTIDLIFLCTIAYTIHSVTNRKPIEIVHSAPRELESQVRDNSKEPKTRASNNQLEIGHIRIPNRRTSMARNKQTTRY